MQFNRPDPPGHISCERHVAAAACWRKFGEKERLSAELSLESAQKPAFHLRFHLHVRAHVVHRACLGVHDFARFQMECYDLQIVSCNFVSHD